MMLEGIIPLITVVLGIIYLLKTRTEKGPHKFSILHRNGDAFLFDTKDYPVEELKQFAQQVDQIKAGKSNGVE